MLIKLYCPNPKCRTSIEWEEETPKDGDVIREDCPSCKHPFEVRVLILLEEVLFDVSPAKTG